MAISKCTFSLAAFLLSSAIFAAHDRPINCPDLNWIKDEGMTMSSEIFENMYFTYNSSHYDTPSNWIFIMGPMIAESENLALEESNQLLSTMSGHPLPEEDDDDGTWLCDYETGNKELAAFAIQTNQPLAGNTLRKYLKKLG